MLGSRTVHLLMLGEQAVSLSKAYPPNLAPRLPDLVTCSLS